MKISQDGILFDKLSELEGFVSDLNLAGIVRLKKPVEDKSGKVLIKEDIVIQKRMLEKLRDHEGQYQSEFNIQITDEVMRQMRIYLASTVCRVLEERDADFIRHLYDGSHHRYRSYIEHSFRKRSLTLLLYRTARNNPNFFHHLSLFGLLSLGIALQLKTRVHFQYRYAFLCGLGADLGLADSNDWTMLAELDSVRFARAQKCAAYLETLQLAPAVVRIIRDHIIPLEKPLIHSEEEERQFSAGLGPAMDEIITDETDEPDEQSGDVEEDGGTIPDMEERTELIVLEIMKVSRFLIELTRRIQNSEHFAETLVYMLAYNAARGHFYERLINPVLEKFRRYEKMARHMMEIAHIEKKCLYPPSAWAYPKPNATQILCRNRIQDCPKLERGWDIHVISPQEAFGRIGDTLTQGNYPKCALEAELQATLIREENLTGGAGSNKRGNSRPGGDPKPADH